MRDNKNGLDEMQRDRRNHIGNQMFVLMFYVLLANAGLYSAGIRWLDYPGNVMVISTVCMGIYLVRLVMLNAYLPPKAQNRRTVVTLMLAVVFSVLFAGAAMKLFEQPLPQAPDNTNDHSAIILMIVSIVGLLAAFLVSMIKKANHKEEQDE